MRAVIGAALISLCLTTIVWCSPAAAVGAADGWVDRNTGDIGVGAGESTLPPVGGGKARPSKAEVTCTYSPVDADVVDAAEAMAKNGWGNPRGDGPGSWMRKVCSDGTGTVVWVPQRQADPRALAQEALDQTNVPLPGVGMNPAPPHDAVVNMATWLWVENFGAVEASASAGAVTVNITASPVSVRWSMGNGDVVVCNGSGTRYDSSRAAEDQRTDCSYTYRRSSASVPSGTFVVQTTVTWDVTWTASGAAGGGSLGPLTRTSSTPVRVSEVQTVNQ